MTILAGVTSTGAGGAGAGAAAGGGTAVAEPAAGLDSGTAAVVLRPAAESLASIVRPLKLLLPVVELPVIVGGELIGESSAIEDRRGGSLIGAP